MNFLPSLKKLAAGLSLIGACASANASVTDLGTLGTGLTPFGGYVAVTGAPNFFNDVFKFITPANGGSAYSVVNFPVSSPGGSFNTLFTSASLMSNPDGIVGNGDDALLQGAIASGNALNLSWGPTPGGKYYLVVSGQTTGSLGGLYSGAISVSPVPEPETYGLFLAGLGLLGTIMTRRRKV